MKQLHEIQLAILNTILFKDWAKYSELKTDKEMENSQFVFHLDKLIELKLIEKNGEKYKLTPSGKEYANRLTTETTKIGQQAKITTVLCATRIINNNTELLVYKRLKNPFYGCMGFPTEKVKWGENIALAAKRGLKEEAGLDAEPTLFAIKHYKIHSPAKILLEDKLMHGFMFTVSEQKALKTNENSSVNTEGNYFWVPEKLLKQKIKKPLEEFWGFYKSLKDFNGNISFEEISLETEKF